MFIVKVLLLAFGLSYVLMRILLVCGVPHDVSGLITAWFLLISIPAIGFKMSNPNIKCSDAYLTSIKMIAILFAITMIGGFFAFILDSLI